MNYRIPLLMLVFLLSLSALGACNHTQGYSTKSPTDTGDGSEGGGGEGGGSY